MPCRGLAEVAAEHAALCERGDGVCVLLSIAGALKSLGCGPDDVVEALRNPLLAGVIRGVGLDYEDLLVIARWDGRFSQLAGPLREAIEHGAAAGVRGSSIEVSADGLQGSLVLEEHLLGREETSSQASQMNFASPREILLGSLAASLGSALAFYMLVSATIEAELALQGAPLALARLAVTSLTAVTAIAATLSAALLAASPARNKRSAAWRALKRLAIAASALAAAREALHHLAPSIGAE